MIRIVRLFPATVALVLTLVLGACSSSSSPKDPMDALRVLLPGRTALSGLALQDSVIAYERNTVWDHLGQQAELFLNNGLDKLATATYTASDNSGSIKIELILFQEPVNAFTMYSLHRNPAARFVEISSEAYILGDTLAFLKGRYLGSILRTGNVGDAALEKAAIMISDDISDTSVAFPFQLSKLPAEGRIPHSEFLLPRDQEQHEETPEFYGCQYVVNGDTVTLHFMLNSQVGISTATGTFLGKQGSIDEWLMEGQYQSLVGMHPDRGFIFCAQQEGTLAVVTGFTDRKDAKALVERLFQSISKP